MLCSKCGNENPESNRFCGLCGAFLERRAQQRRGGERRSRDIRHASHTPPRPEAEPRIVPLSRLEEAAPPEPRREKVREVTMGGPSFLGLSDSGGDSGSEYLLEDEESQPNWRARIVFVVLVLVAILAALQWRASRGDFANLTNPTPPVAKAAPEIPKDQPIEKQATPPAQEAASISTDEPKREQVSPAAVDEVPQKSAEAEERSNQKVQEDQASSGDGAPESVHRDTSRPNPMLQKAQQYLQGRGVPRDCEQGMVYLRAAAAEDDPRAQVQMGALYASGNCVPLDRVQAYKWFSSALALDPSNRWIERDRSQLWANMSSTERQRAGAQ